MLLLKLQCKWWCQDGLFDERLVLLVQCESTETSQCEAVGDGLASLGISALFIEVFIRAEMETCTLPENGPIFSVNSKNGPFFEFRTEYRPFSKKGPCAVRNSQSGPFLVFTLDYFIPCRVLLHQKT